MKTSIAALALSLLLVGTAHAQDDPFNGVWKLDQSKSITNGSPLPEVEIITLKHENNAETGINDITDNGRRSRSTYTATFDDGQWYRGKSLDTGEESRGFVRMIRMSERSELRLGKRADGTFSGMFLRQVSEDGKTMQVMWYRADGSILQELHFDKQ